MICNLNDTERFQSPSLASRWLPLCLVSDCPPPTDNFMYYFFLFKKAPAKSPQGGGARIFWGIFMERRDPANFLNI